MAQRVAFRFLFAYLALYLVLVRFLEADLAMQHEFGFAPGAGVLLSAYANWWAPIVAWVGHHVLRIGDPLVFQPGGNSDGLFGFVQLFCLVAIAAMAAAVWTLVGRRSEYRRLFRSLHVVTRYALAFSMLSYGMVKVLLVQFHFPGLQELLVPLGDMPPFMMLGNFMGSSAVYTVFAGAGEVLAGLLLLHKRTATLGALVALAIMTNVLMLNVSYNWPEKLDALHMLLLAAVVMIPDAARLANVLVLNRPTNPASPDARTRTRRERMTWITIKAIVVAYMLVSAPLVALNLQKVDPPPSVLRGIYHVDEFSLNGVVSPPSTTNASRWETVIFDAADAFTFQTMDHAWRTYRAEYEPREKQLTIFAGRATPSPSVLVVSAPVNEQLTLQGVFQSDTLLVQLSRVDESQFALLRGRFRWINGQP
ncbi:MAG: hypothetical protein ABI542_05035 [Gemmatimonadota bacterium]